MAYLLELNIPLDPLTGQSSLTISTCIPDKHKEFIRLFLLSITAIIIFVVVPNSYHDIYSLYIYYIILEQS